MDDKIQWAFLTENETVEPADWNEMENIGQRMMNEIMQYLKNVSSKPEYNKPAETLAEKN